MQVMKTPVREIKHLQTVLEDLIKHSLCLKRHVLFPNCVYLTSTQHNNEVEEANFYLIFETKKDRDGLPHVKIHYIQIPLLLRKQHLGTKVYRLLEECLRNNGCLSIELEARVNTLDPRDNSVGFWGKQGFLPRMHYAFDDENFPMIKRLI